MNLFPDSRFQESDFLESFFPDASSPVQDLSRSELLTCISVHDNLNPFICITIGWDCNFFPHVGNGIIHGACTKLDI